MAAEGTALGSLGADLHWWRERDGVHTLVTVFGGFHEALAIPLQLTFVLFDDKGRETVRWRTRLDAYDGVFADSARQGAWSAGGVGEGVLAIFVDPADGAGAKPRTPFQRLYSLVDWYSDDGHLASLHSDQSLRAGTACQQLTEMVVREAEDERNSLVILNGDRPQPGGALRLRIANHRGDVLEAIRPTPMEPFTVHRVGLRELFGDLTGFAEGRELVLEGTLETAGIYTRPYVVTEGRVRGVYHGGDRYHWKGLPAVHYKLLGEGELNPMAAVHTGAIRTTINLLHSHGDIEEDFAVDACLWDAQGRLVTERRPWLRTRRGGVCRADLAELLPDPSQDFMGQIVLSFSAAPAAVFPRRLQALLEYRGSGFVSRVMAWSDEWNSGVKHGRIRLTGGEGTLLPSFYRVFGRADFRTHLSIANCGHPGYAARAPYRLRLRNTENQELTETRELPPQATHFFDLNAVFPTMSAFLGRAGVGIVIVESPADLAVIQLTERISSQTWAVEHLMGIPRRLGDSLFYVAGI